MSEDIVSTSQETERSECYLYHIHRSKNKDLDKGYIGISNNPNYRYRKHRENPNSILKNAFKKYDDITMSVIEEGSRKDMLEKESELRPVNHMGWNIAPGGSMPPSWDLMTEQEAAARKKAISDRHKGILKNHGDKIKLTKAGKPIIATNIETGEEIYFKSVTHAVSFTENPISNSNGQITRVLKGDRKSHAGHFWRFADTK